MWKEVFRQMKVRKIVRVEFFVHSVEVYRVWLGEVHSALNSCIHKDHVEF